VKLTVTQLITNLPAFYETQRFITAFTRACQQTCPGPDALIKCTHI